ncbi:MAG TPA: site-specific integrase [Ktedonobacteraceae bacterium]
MGKRPALGYFYLQRLDALMAIGESRHQAKQALREASAEKHWNLSTGKIHSHGTRKVYQQQVMAFVDWVKKTHHVTDHRIVEVHADEWVCQYLQKLIERGKSPYTLHTVRSALRMVFGREIASSVAMPKRKRSEITRSRRLSRQAHLSFALTFKARFSSCSHSQQSSSPQLQVSPVRASCRASRPSLMRK